LRVTLADTGPIVAFLNARDRHHRWAVETMAQLRPPLLTCESVLSEAASGSGGAHTGQKDRQLARSSADSDQHCELGPEWVEG